jgi:hypothetical protein
MTTLLGFFTKLPVTEDDRLWVDEGLLRLEAMLGRDRMLDAKVMLPIATDFPDPYDKSEDAAELLLQRICFSMQVDRTAFEFEVFPEENEGLRELLPVWEQSGGQSAAGLYFHQGEGNRKCVIAVKSKQLKDPMALVATIAHELGHFILLGGGLMDGDTPDHEPMTDLLTVYLGFGVFTANSAARFSQFQDGQRQGWSMSRLGYLSEQVFGYALAKFSMERGESKQEWEKYLSTNVRSYFNRSRSWLNKKT